MSFPPPPSDLPEEEQIALSDVVPLPRFIELMERDGLATENQIRWIVRHRASNGLSEAGAILQPGGRQLYVVVPRWHRWLLQQVA